MPSNREWLNDLAANDPQKLNVWFEAEHVDDNDEISKLKAERDEWKAKAEAIKEESLKERVYWHNEVHAILDNLNGRERFWGACMEYPLDEHSLSPSEVARRMIDELKAKADKYQQHMWEFSNWHTATAKLLGIGIDPENSPTDEMIQDEIELRIIKLLQAEAKSAKRAAAVERLRLNPMGKSLAEIVTGLSHTDSWDDKRNALIDLLTDEQMDAQRDSNWTCPDGNGTASNTSDNLGKSQDSEIDEPDTIRNELEDNGYVVMPYHNGEKQAKLRGKEYDQVIFDELHDSREKLRKDIINYTMDAYNGCWLIDVDTIDEWLDRQAEITAKRLCADCTPNVAEERDYLRGRVDELNTQVQEQSELIAARGKTIEALEKFMSERKYKLKKQLESKTEQCRKLKAERDEYRELYEAAMSTDYGQLSKEHEQFREEISEMLDAAQQIERVRAKHETQLN